MSTPSSKKAGGKPPEGVLEPAAKLFATLAERSRLAILRELMDGPRPVGDIAEATGLSQPNVSKQLAVLHDAKLVSRERDGNTVRYAIADNCVVELCSLVCAKLARDHDAMAKQLKG